MTERVIRVVLDPSGVTSGGRSVENQLNRIEKQGTLLGRSLKVAAAAASGVVAAFGVRELARTANTYQTLQNRLRIVTDTTEELTSVQRELFEISQDTRGSFEATTELFSRAAIAADELGASQEQLLRLTEISGKALAIQGSSAAEAAGALRQLSQSFSSGIVRAEEFNSILEGAFPIAQAAARGIDEAGGSVGRLRNLVVAGEIDSREFFNAILEGGAAIDDQFGKTEVTLSQATQTISNSFLNLVGKLNEVTGAGRGAARILVGISDSIDDLTAALTGALTPTDELSTGLKVIATTALVAGRAVSILAEQFGTTLVTAFELAGEAIGGAAAGIFAFISGEFSQAADIFDDLGERLKTGFRSNIDELQAGLVADTVGTIESLVEIWDRGSRQIAEAATIGGDGEALAIVPANTIKDVEEARDAVDEFIAKLVQQRTELELQRDLGDDAAEAIRRYREDLALAGAENEIFGELIPTDEVNALRESFLEFSEEALQAQRALREEIENEAIRQSFEDQIEALEEEIFLLTADNEAIAANAAIRALAAGATIEQAEAIRALTLELETTRDALEEEKDALTDFFADVREEAQSALGGFLADPLSEGLDELPFKFAQTLQQLAADALASEFLSIITGLFSGAAGGGAGGGGGIAGIIGSLFGGGFQAGGATSGRRPILVGERGPELFQPPGSGTVTPNVNINQAAQAPPMVVVNNITDPADIPAGLNTAEGSEAVLNIIQRNPDQVRRILG